MTNLTDILCGCGGKMIVQTDAEQSICQEYGGNALLLSCENCKLSQIYKVINDKSD